ncbi:TPA: hypothetical protein ACIBOM_001638 [Salmonella enterica subsp. enterica serovar Reading]|nr:hypothetical protein [Salmonella enterica]HEC7605850.1 hypothetical protein [Salmonella enterica subsp. enterica serovar Muenchen]
MKLAVRNISTSESHVTGIAIIDKNLLWATFPFCSFEVCVDRVDGKSLEQYESELLAKARERIAEMYKEIVCGGQISEAGGLLDYLGGKIEPSELGKEMLEQIKNNHSNNDLEGRVAALEKRLGEQTSPDMLKAIHEVSKKAAQEFLSQCELKKTVVHDINGESSTFYNPDGTVRLQVGRLNDKHDEYTRIEATFPVMKYPRLITEKGIFDIKKIPRIGGKVEITLSEGNVLSLEYEEDYDPATTLEGYEARAKEYASRVMSEIKKAH